MPSAKTDPMAVETAVNFGKLLGAAPYFIDPTEYDSLSRGVEILPGLIAAGLFQMVQTSNSWQDILKFADLPFIRATAPLEIEADEMAFLALNNKEVTLRWLNTFVEEMNKLRQLLNDGDEEILSAHFQESGQGRADWLRARKENDWVEENPINTEPLSFTDRLLGGFARKRLGKSSE